MPHASTDTSTGCANVCMEQRQECNNMYISFSRQQKSVADVAKEAISNRKEDKRCNSLLFLTSNRFGGVRREGKFKVLNKFYNCYRTHRSGLISLKVTILGGWYISLPPLETTVAIDWVCCRFFICLYDLNTVCFLSSSSWDVVETQILVCLCSAHHVGVVPGDELECLVE